MMAQALEDLRKELDIDGMLYVYMRLYTMLYATVSLCLLLFNMIYDGAYYRFEELSW